LDTSDAESNKNASKQNGVVHLGTFEIRAGKKIICGLTNLRKKKTLLEIASF